MLSKYSNDVLLKAFHSAQHNKKEIMAGNQCGCFSCKNIFPTYEIRHWIRDEIGDTALCPYCFLEAVIGEKSGYPITTDFLTAMNEHWYCGKFSDGTEWWFYRYY